jgi:predicted amidohydrolase YtcJ
MSSRLATFIVVSIVVATFVVGLIVGAQRDDQRESADLVVLNGRVYASGGTPAAAEAVAVKANRILKVGTSNEIKRTVRKETVVLDAHGGSVLPGFDDAHLHLMSGGLGLERVDLLDAVNLDQINEKIRAYAAAHPEKPWVLGRGWYYGPFPGGLPTRQQLDALVPDRPAYMRCYDGHTGWANSKAVALAGITRRTPDPKGGIIVKDPKTGDPTGALKEAAQDLMDEVLPKPSREDKLRAIRAAIALAHRFGITSVQNAGGDAEEIGLFDEIRRGGDLKLRVYVAMSVDAPFKDADADRLDQIRARLGDDPLLKTGAAKMYIDGVIEAHTAVMLAPYANRPTKGEPLFSADELDRIVTLLDRRGWQVMIHAIGDGGVRMALDACERAAAANPPPARGRRHRLEHIETVDPADIPRFGRLGVIAVQQPFHGNPSGNQLDVWTANIGLERASRGWAQKSISAAGGRLAIGSDWPVVSLDPRLELNMAVNRTTPEGTPAGGWLPEQRITLGQALDAYTSGAAYASFDEERKGRVAPGMLADLVIMSTDLFALPPARLLDAVVDVTIFDGKVVYTREPGQKRQGAATSPSRQP